MVTSLPRHVGVVADAAVTEHIWGLLGDQDPDLVHRAAELQIAQVEAWGELFSTVLVERHQVLQHTHIYCWCENESSSGKPGVACFLTWMVMMRMSSA